MKKVLVLLICCLVLGGCAESKPKSVQGNVETSEIDDINIAEEYTYAEIKKISDQFWDDWIKETSELSDIEWRGTSTDEDDMDEHFFNISNKYVDKVMKNCVISQNKKVIVSGYISKATELPEKSIFVRKGAGKILFFLKRNAEDDTYEGISCRTDDLEFLKLEENTPVKIEGVFMKQGVAASENDVYDCKVIEYGEPESVTETKAPITTAAYK